MHLRSRHLANATPENSLSSSNPRRSERLTKSFIAVRIRQKTADGKDIAHKMGHSDQEETKQRRNPKRKAAAEPQSHVLPDSLLEEAVKPICSDDIGEWDGWIELESEPAFFNTILKGLGVNDVKVQELFTVEQDSLDILPKPVYGLIFLFQYAPGLDIEEAEDEDGPVWFANQTTSNACATVALLNIVMNHDSIDLGSELKTFKETTFQMSTAVRGYELGRNKFIRKTHNSFARRMDCLNADLFLENEASDSKSQKHTPATRVMSRKKKPKKRSGNDYGYHFIAYVPSGGFVWELDGLCGKPRKLGSFEDDCWTNVARPQIEARMLQYEESQLSFNLLSLCQSPIQKYRKSVLTAIAAVHYLDAQMKMHHGDAYGKLLSESDGKLNTEDSQLLAEYDLKLGDISTMVISNAFKEKVQEHTHTIADAVAFRYGLVIEAQATMGEYRGEFMAAMVDEERVAARKKDYGSVLHKWICKLAEKEVLEDIIKISS
ncbi:hypothetical protein NLG97_g7868 [Lecanicillium saksenae]|uniref:Uncharacterized protein n=1 Tax=Lecanicillium saksenae TaxID=468837 RepID=A0ACC1QKM6_9HYPO|nr:hypothetical protein NLG97_g7868 [Lecanicillium saksenae]